MAKADDRKRERQQKEVDKNYKAFQERLPSIIVKHRGKWALMRHKKIVDFFETSGKAWEEGEKLYGKGGRFSIQKVTDIPEDLGFFSRFPARFR